jgi:hypothetical protein
LLGGFAALFLAIGDVTGNVDNAATLDGLSHYAAGTARSPNLKVSSTSSRFGVAIEGSTIRLAHRRSGHVFEYLWCEEPPVILA